MPKIIKANDGTVSVRLDGAYVAGGKHLVEPFIKEDDNGNEKKRFFGTFKFTDNARAKKTLTKAVQESPYNDTVFEGPYPNWKEDEFGEGLTCQNRVKFYKTVNTREEINPDDINDYEYALEVHLKKSREDGIFLVVARAVATGERSDKYDDELFDDITAEGEDPNEKSDSEQSVDDTPEPKAKTEKPKQKALDDIDIADDDLPF